MTIKNKRTFTPEFRLEAAQLVLEQNYSIKEAAQAMNVAKSTMNTWVNQLKKERSGKTPKSAAMTPEQIKIKALEKQLARVEMENEILKKATALLMSDSLKSLR